MNHADMNEEQLNKLFQEVRETPPVTSPDDVSAWVSSAAQSVGSGLSTKSFFTFKGITMITTIASVIGIAVFSYFAPVSTPEDRQPPTVEAAEHEIAQPLPAREITPTPAKVVATREKTAAPAPIMPEIMSEITPLPAPQSGLSLAEAGHAPAISRIPLLSVAPGSAPVVRDEFTRLKISSALKVWITQGDNCDVRIETEEGSDCRSLVDIDQSGETLELALKSSFLKLRDFHTINVYITIRELKELEVSGAVDVRSKNKLLCQKLDMDLSGAVKTQLDLSAGDVTVECSGAVKLELQGECKTLDIDMSGATKVLATEMSVDVCHVETSGAGSIDVAVTKELRVDSSGASSVTYRGDPEVLKIRTSGAAEVRKFEVKKLKETYKF
ncbi:MAG: head GIN domain-containing protein [Bacteroidota bacterium]